MDFKTITSHEAACEVLGKDPSLSPTTDQQTTDIFNAVNKLNGNFKADFKDSTQKKWRPFFYVDASGFRFLDSLCGRSDSAASVGSRLCHYVGSEEEAYHIGNQFLDLFEKHYLGE